MQAIKIKLTEIKYKKTFVEDRYMLSINMNKCSL